MTFEEFVNGKSAKESVLLKLCIISKDSDKVRIFWDLCAQLIKQGIRKPELFKIIDNCNSNNVFNVDRAIKLLVDRSLKTYEKQKECLCHPYMQQSTLITTDKERCSECGAFFLETKIGV